MHLFFGYVFSIETDRNFSVFCASQIRDEKASIDVVLELILRGKNNRDKKISVLINYSFFDANATQNSAN